jgi:DNA mismatch endonuclease (patch repair protein)
MTGKDSLTPEQRRANMRAVRRKDTAPEMRLRRALWREGLRYRANIHVANTTPDVVFTRARVAVFVDGCFWHGCPEHYKLPRTRPDYWKGRLQRNVDRDARDNLKLQAAGYTVLRYWACDIRRDLDGVVREISHYVRGQ